MRLVIAAILFLTASFAFSQENKLTISGHVIDEISEKSIADAKVRLKGNDGSQSESLTDSLGIFSLSLESNVIYKITIEAKSHLTMAFVVEPEMLRDTTLKVYLSQLEKGSFMTEFVFLKDSSGTPETGLYEAWGLNDYKDTTLRIIVIGYCSPDESDSIAMKRAKAVVNGFLEHGANPKSFIAEGRPKAFPDIYLDQRIKVNGKDVLLKRETELSDEYLNGVTEYEKEAIYSFMRRVQLEFEKW